MKTLSLALALATPIQAALRFGCSTLTIQRLDPVVEHGVVGSAHLHHIIGGNAFNATMEGDIGEKGTCTTCTFSEDFSNYWTAVLYLKAANGSYKMMPIYQNTALPNGINGGMTVYYTQRDFQGNGNVKITSFKPGFRMVIGNPASTSTNAPGLKWVCLQDKGTRFPELNDIPQRACPGGIMSVHHFPACWDGKNLDSPDHQSHMANTNLEAFQNARPCPSTHPVRVAQVAYETLYDTRAYNAEIARGGKFVLSTGDDKGFGTHADYLFGWKGDSLQRAMDHSCMFNACENGRPLKSQGVSAMNNCKIAKTVHEDIDSWSATMPGGKVAA